MKKRIDQIFSVKFWYFVIYITLFIVLIYWIYSQSNGWVWPDWTGFGEYTGSIPKDNRPKTLYDFLQLLIIPAVLSGGALYFDASQKKREQRNATDKQREDLLRDYFKEIGRLMTEKDLLKTKGEEESPVRLYAQVLTTTSMRSLNTQRQDQLFRFLLDSKLGEFLLISAALSSTDLRRVKISNLNLSKADLSGATLSNADLSLVDLSGANLEGANLSGADLQSANLEGAKLNDADLSGAKLMNANLNGVYLGHTDLSKADLMEANLKGAHLWRPYLGGASLLRANLSGAFLNEVDLSKVYSLEGATMPDGTVHP